MERKPAKTWTITMRNDLKRVDWGRGKTRELRIEAVERSQQWPYAIEE